MGRKIGVFIIAAGVILILVRALLGGMGTGQYEVIGEGKTIKRTTVTTGDLEQRRTQIMHDESLTDADRQTQLAELEKNVQFSPVRTIGVWLAAFFTLCILSFLYKDSPFYRLAESIFVGASAAYWMVVTFWNMAVPIGIGRLFPRFVKFNLAPGHPLDEWVEKLAAENWLSQWGIVDYGAAVGQGLNAPWYLLMNWWYWIPMVLGVMLLWRLAPSGQWISRWPLAFVIGGTAGLRMVAYLQADFVAQISAATAPLVVTRDGIDAGQPYDFGLAFYFSLKNVVLLLGLFATLVYFFFSLEHKGVVGRISRIGVWVLMVTFGAGFGFTVMGRIALLVGRFEFLVRDWINYQPI